MNRKSEIIQTIEKMSGRYSPYDIFRDWVKCSALAVQNACCLFHDEIWDAREKEYVEVISRYNPEEQQQLSVLFSMLVETMDTYMSDVLGEIYMEGGMGSKSTGQFFTPFNVSEMTARVSLQDPIASFNGEMMQLNEPSSGGGGMIIAAAKVLKDAGINYQRYLDVVAQDLDWNGVYMTYLQCSLYGIRAIVVQGNTLTDPYDPAKTAPYNIMRTPAKMGALI